MNNNLFPDFPHNNSAAKDQEETDAKTPAVSNLLMWASVIMIVLTLITAIFFIPVLFNLGNTTLLESNYLQSILSGQPRNILTFLGEAFIGFGSTTFVIVMGILRLLLSVLAVYNGLSGKVDVAHWLGIALIVVNAIILLPVILTFARLIPMLAAIFYTYAAGKSPEY
ncbi:MAG: hypothetical protein GX907_03885 [Clostridiaceae bacterium]|nr:hypothetical protein [Clostridiaceae bacterium]